MSKKYEYNVNVYYEDTDFSGVVYHANYLRFMERAREEAIGQNKLVDYYNTKKLGFAVYKLDITYKEGAVFGDKLVVETTIEKASEYRYIFNQNIKRAGEDKFIILSKVELVCLIDNKMSAFPDEFSSFI